MRRGLEARVKATAEEHSLPSPETLKADDPARYKTRRFWRYFRPKRGRKMEWGEVSSTVVPFFLSSALCTVFLADMKMEEGQANSTCVWLKVLPFIYSVYVPPP